MGLIVKESLSTTPSQVRLTLHDEDVWMGVELVVFFITEKEHDALSHPGVHDPETLLDDQLSVFGSPGHTFVIAALTVSSWVTSSTLSVSNTPTIL